VSCSCTSGWGGSTCEIDLGGSTTAAVSGGGGGAIPRNTVIGIAVGCVVGILGVCAVIGFIVVRRHQKKKMWWKIQSTLGEEMKENPKQNPTLEAARTQSNANLLNTHE
jgi:hypothetical protein